MTMYSFGFALKALEAAGILGQVIRQGLDGHVPIETRVPGQTAHTHATAADLAVDEEGADLSSGLK